MKFDKKLKKLKTDNLDHYLKVFGLFTEKYYTFEKNNYQKFIKYDQELDIFSLMSNLNVPSKI